MNEEVIEVNYTIAVKAMSFLGVQEKEGKANNKQILDMFVSAGFEGLGDEVPWCAAFVTHVLKECGYSYIKSLKARDYQHYGCATGYPMLGNIVVLWRESEDSQFGHVGFFIRKDKHHVWLLGGNQSDKVSVQKYPRKRVISYRQALYSS